MGFRGHAEHMQIELLLSTVQEPWDPLQQVLEKVC
jgi:hypothetical protein